MWFVGIPACKKHNWINTFTFPCLRECLGFYVAASLSDVARKMEKMLTDYLKDANAQTWKDSVTWEGNSEKITSVLNIESIGTQIIQHPCHWKQEYVIN